MPFALALALVASLGIHAAALFGPDFDLVTEPETLPLHVELKALPPTPMRPAIAPPAKQKSVARHAQAPSPSTDSAASSVMRAPGVVDWPERTAGGPPPGSTLPERGRISYRVETGESGLGIGRAVTEWTIADGQYRLLSVVETVGLLSLFRPLRMEMESVGTAGPAGLRPDRFVIRRNGKETAERADFDWSAMKVTLSNRGEQSVQVGAQDILSLNFQLGLMSHPDDGSMIPVVTGKKYGVYRLEILGDEEIDLPAGKMRTLHLRTPGDKTTELWLAYDYLLLPVKIRHLDAKGGSMVQVATEIQVGQ